MTISSTTNRKEYTGNGVTTAFPYPYPFYTNSDLVVYERTIATGAIAKKTNGSDFTVSGAGSPSGGTVTAASPPPNTKQWIILSDAAITQDIKLVNGEKIDVDAAINTPLDFLTRLVQRQNDRNDRSIHAPDGDLSSTATMELPNAQSRAGRAVVFDANGNAGVADMTQAALEAAVAQLLTGNPIVGAPKILQVSKAVATIPNLDDMAGAAAALGAVLSIDTDYTLTKNTTLTSDVRYDGGKITRGSYTLAFNANFEAPALSQVFDAAGTGLVTFTSVKEISAPWFGVKGDGSDETAPWTAVFASAAASSNAPINGYRRSSKITGALTVSVGVSGKNLYLDHYPADNTTDLLTVNGGDYSPNFDVIRLEDCRLRAQQGGSTNGRDLIRINRGDHIQLKNVLLAKPVRDGLHTEPDTSGHWVENLTLENVKVQSAGRDAFRFEVPDTLTNVFANQISLIECESRGALGSALSLVCNNTVAAANKISGVTSLNCEFGCSGAVSTPIINIQGPASGGSVENVWFNACAVEDTASARTGFGILVSGRVTGSFSYRNGVIFGTGGGRISGHDLFPWFEADTGSSSDNIFRSHAGIAKKYRTASLAQNATENADYKLNISEVLLITALNRFSSSGWKGAWLVHGQQTPLALVETGVSLAVVTSGSDKLLQITNLSASSASIEIFITRLVADTSS